MQTESFSDATLILFGHGTTLNPESCATVKQHAAELRSRGIFASVQEAFWKQEPRLADILPTARTSRVFLAPFFMSAGYFCERIIPTELGFCPDGQTVFVRKQTRSAQTWYYCHPVGTHPKMTEVLLSVADGVLRQFPFPRRPNPANTTLFVAGHGTSQDANSRRAVELQAEAVQAKGIFAAVKAVFMEEEPLITGCHALAATRNIVVTPFFVSDGLHVREDIPVMLGEPKRLVSQRLANGQPTWRNPTEKHGKLIWYSRSVGTDPRMADVILDRVFEAARF